MRVITGKYKGRTLVAPKTATRPTLDRTKETLFNIINGKIPDSFVVDLFAGSGQLAIECLSRGARRAVLCDSAKDAVCAIKTNFQKIGETPELYFCHYKQCLERLKNGNADIVFVDPPYKEGLYGDVMHLLHLFNVVGKEGIVVCEHSANDVLPLQTEGFRQYDCRKIGSVKFIFYKRRESCE